MQTYRSRWGNHPCDYATFRKLKAIHKAYQEGLRQLAAQRRYLAKLPHNRALKAKGVEVPDVHREICGSRYDIPQEYHHARHGRPPEEVKPLAIPPAVMERWASQLANPVPAP